MDADITGSANFTARTGDTWQSVVNWKQGDRTPFDLTGYTARMMIRKAWDSTTVNASISTGSGIAITPLEGKISMTLSPSQTANLTASPYVYDLELTSPAGVVTTILSGKFTVLRDVSR